MLDASHIWLGVLVACLAWYGSVTIYVAVRGAFDIKHMLARLRESQSDDSED
jgi:hypothetical protein